MKVRSYIKTSSGWTDAASYGLELRIKAITNYKDSNTKNDSAQITNAQSNNTQSNSTVNNVNTAAKVNISKAAVKKLSNYTYTGKKRKPSPTLTYNGIKLKLNKDYTVSYKNNSKPGKSTIIIKGIGNYTGTKNVYFYIVLKRINVKSVKAIGNKKLTLTWKSDKLATGYYIQIATNKKFTKGVKRYFITNKNTTKKTISNLKKGKTYYVRLRAYKKVGSKKYYGNYGKVKTIKIK